MVKPRDHLARIEPYELPGGAPGTHRERLLQLAQNENVLGASPLALEAARRACEQSGYYPDPDAGDLRRTLSGLHGIDADRIVCARGAMELISLLATVYLEPGASAVVSQFGYLYFRSAAEIAGAEVIAAPEPSLRVDVDAVAASVAPTTRMVFIANPGNPTGTYLRKSELVRLRRSLPDSVLLVVDEAYAEFVDGEDYRACFDMVDAGATSVLRTFSKVYGLAGLRVGWGYFPPDVVQLLRAVQQPNSVTGPAQAAASAAARDQSRVESQRESVRRIREEFTGMLRAQGLDPVPAQGNFVLVRFDSDRDAAGAHAQLLRDGIVVRPMQGYGLAHCLRITLGSREQMLCVARSIEHWSRR